MNMLNKVDPMVMLLAALLIFFTFALFFAELWFKSDGVFFQTVATTMSGIGGALLMKITGKDIPHSSETSDSTTKTHTEAGKE